MIIRGNTVTGRIVGNGNSNLLISDNIVRGDGKAGAVMQFGYTKGLTVRGNAILGTDNNQTGLYVWGNSRYNKQPGEDVLVVGNQITAAEQAISLNGAKNVRITGNLLTAPRPLLERRTENIVSDNSIVDSE